MKNTFETMCKQINQSFITNKQFATAKQWINLNYQCAKQLINRQYSKQWVKIKPYNQL